MGMIVYQVYNKKQKSSLLDYPFVDILNYPIHKHRAISQTNYKSGGKSKF